MFPLLEELKIANFEIQLKKEKQSKIKEEEIINSYVNENIEKIRKVLDKYLNFFNYEINLFKIFIIFLLN